MKFRSVALKICALLLAVGSLALTLSACGSQTQINQKKVVGEVDGVKIYYDELYALSHYYSDTARTAASKSGAEPSVELDRLIRENIITNTAMLRLCESKGLTYDEDSLKTEIDAEWNSTLSQSFDGDEEAFRANLSEQHLTERYVRYSIGIELLYEKLSVQYPALGLVVSGEENVRAHIQSNFVHVYHLVRFYDEENQAEQYAKMQEALSLLNKGATMYEMVKDGYSEDFLDPSANGYYFTKGSMDEQYEAAAFSLQMNEISGIVDAKGYDNNGVYSSCYYILQRAPLEEAYIDEHLSELQDEYYNTVIYADLQETKASMTFVPNDFYESLTLTELLPPREGMPTWALVTVIVGGAVILAGGIAVAVILIRKRPRQAKAVVRRKR